MSGEWTAEDWDVIADALFDLAQVADRAAARWNDEVRGPLYRAEAARARRVLAKVQAEQKARDSGAGYIHGDDHKL